VKKINIRNIIIFILVFIGLSGIIIGVDLTFNKPTTFNRIIAAKLYKEPANKAFTDQNFYNCVVDAYNNENKTSLAYTETLTEEQLKTITKLSCSGARKEKEKLINNTHGIEKLTALTYLDLKSNNISVINVSANTSLTYLELSYNYIAKIDVSANTLLTYLDLRHNNIIEIDVTKNTKLMELHLHYNKLKNINVSKNILLTHLGLNYNNLSSLDISQNTHLTHVYLFGNNLDSINVSYNVSLQSLYLADNNLSRIDVSHNSLLSILGLDGNDLNNLNLSSNVLLDRLLINDNKFSKEYNIYSGETINLDKNDVVVLPQGKNATIISVNGLEDCVVEQNNITFNKVGTYEFSVSFEHALKEYSTDNNTFSIKYKVNVLDNAQNNPNDDNTLKELKLNNGTINFKSSTTTYNVTVDAPTTTITATANDKKATVSGAGTKTLNDGVNTFKIVVTAENGSTKTYTLNITKKDNRSSNANLSSLTLGDEKISFEKNKTNYEIVVDYKIEEITIDGKLEDEKSKVEGLGTKTLQVGENTFVVKVTAENGSVKEYKILIIREKEEIVTENNNIKSLKITGHDIKFNSDTKKYIVKTDKQKLDIIVELESDESTYEITGNDDLHDGSIIQIIVTDKEGNNNIYTITIDNPNENVLDKEKDTTAGEDDVNYIPIIMVSIFGVLLVTNGIMLVNKSKKNNNQIN